MKARILHTEERIFVGMKREMTFASDTTRELWKSFMEAKDAVNNRIGKEYYSIQVYHSSFSFKDFNPHIPFYKWAAVEVSDFNTIPGEMEKFVLPEGKYAVFNHRGGPAKAPETFGYIFGQWLPESEFILDNRPHFEVLGEKYSNDKPDSEEEIWIPVRD